MTGTFTIYEGKKTGTNEAIYPKCSRWNYCMLPLKLWIHLCIYTILQSDVLLFLFTVYLDKSGSVCIKLTDSPPHHKR